MWRRGVGALERAAQPRQTSEVLSRCSALRLTFGCGRLVPGSRIQVPEQDDLELVNGIECLCKKLSMKKVNSFEDFAAKHEAWSEKLYVLRELLLACDFEEGIKWGMPAYMVDGKNAIGIGAFKNHIGIWFHQGLFLSDKKKVLRNAQEGKTKGMRAWIIRQDDKLDKRGLKSYFKETIKNHKNGLHIKTVKAKKVSLPEELKTALAASAKLKKAFEKFTPGKQREFYEHIGTAKQSATRLRRLAKCKPMILKGIGLNDKYKK